MNRFLAMGVLAIVSSAAFGGLRDIRAAAEHGDSAMQLQLGELYQYGFGLKGHDVPALAWYLVAAQGGNAEAAQRAAALARSMPASAVTQAHAQSATLIHSLPAPGRSAVTPLQSGPPAP